MILLQILLLNGINTGCGDTTLQAGYPLVPELLVLLHSPAPCGQLFPWEHRYSVGLAHAVGSPAPSALCAAFHEQCSFATGSSPAAAALAREGFANIG